MSSPVLRHYDIAPGVTAFSTTRRGGCSTGSYGAFNVNPFCGDDPAAVDRNRAALCSALGIDEGRLIMPRQNHGTAVRMVAGDLLTVSAATRAMLLDGVDALITDLAGVCIGVSTADCIPVLLYDGEHHACAAVHAGWRGTVGRVVAKTVEQMALSYGTRPAALRACIGPGISAARFEVGDEVFDAFAAAGFPMDRISCRHDKWHIDLWACNAMQLEEAGVPQGNIHIDGTCTYDNSGEFFSARRLGTASGRILTGIMLR